MRYNNLQEKNVLPPDRLVKAKKHQEEEIKKANKHNAEEINKINQQILDELEAISEVGQNPDPCRETNPVP